MENKLIGACGLYCGACDCYRVTLDDGKHLLDTDKFSGKNIEEVSCDGCHSDRLTPWCTACKMRLCAKEKGIDYCGLCSVYPCEAYKEFYDGGYKWDGAKHRRDIMKNTGMLAAEGNEKWLAKQIEDWKCKCGQPFTFYEERCSVCGEKLKSYKNIQAGE